MVLDPEEQEYINPRARNAIRSKNLKWPGNVIPYVIGIEFSEYERAVIVRAMQVYKDNTCIRYYYCWHTYLKWLFSFLGPRILSFIDLAQIMT